LTDPVGIEIGLFGLLLACAAGWYAIGAAFDHDPREATFLQVLFVAALLLRVAVAVGTFDLLPYGYAAPDEVGYVASARALMTNGHLSLEQVLNGEGWQYFNLLLFHLFGVNPLLPRLWNCVVGAVTPIVCFSLARALGAGSGARWSAILVGLFPSLVLWSSLNLKDADVWLLVLAGLLLAIRLQDSLRWWYLPALLVIMAALEPLRRYADEVLLVAVGVSLIVSLRPRRHLASRPGFMRGVPVVFAALAGILVLAAYVFPNVGEGLYHSAGLVQLATLRHNFAIGAHSAINPDPGLGTLRGTLAFLPGGLRDFFLRPFPWETGSGLLEVTRLEAVAYYVSLLFAAVGIVYSLKISAARALPPLAFLLIAGIGYALVIANVGTIYREREQLIVVMFAFVGVGIQAIRLYTSQRRRLVGVRAELDAPQRT
jgi:4-amino-4-deoxy-L-arabinose transferase-like glycosyltransferase